MAGREKGGFWVGVGAMLFYPLTWLGRCTHRGGERIPRTGGALVVMNHVSHFDPVVDGVFVHRNKRIPRFLAKESLFRTPIFGKIIAGSGAIPVRRGSSEAGHSLTAANRALRDGKIVIIYPEGTITKDPAGWPMRPRTGVARLALDNLDKDIPVLPVARWGTQAILNGYTKRFRPFPRKRVTVVVGDPIDLSAYRGREVTNALLREVTELVMNEITALLADIRGEAAPGEPYPRPEKDSAPTPRPAAVADHTDARTDAREA